jgi:hypothetical protein
MRRSLFLSIFALLAASCTQETGTTASPFPSRTIPPIPVIEPGGQPTADAAIKALCVPPEPFSGGPVEAGSLPPEIAELVSQVEQVRGAEFPRPVAVQAITDEVMDSKLEESFDAFYPVDLYARRTVAWRTIGVIGADDDLREAYGTYLTGQVVGFYNPTDGELVYLGEGELGMVERMILAHELTHALDDQRFDLKRLDELAARCMEEDYMAALGLVEGSAQYYASEVLLAFPDLDLGDLAGALGDLLAGEQGLQDVPPFVQALQGWPYAAGQAFVAEIASGGGNGAVDSALRDLPVSTEQIIHPDRYPADVPSEVDIADISSDLGPEWGDLDAMHVGEAWLSAMLSLHLPDFEAEQAAAGWDGGVYRAWSDGRDVVVVIRTAWDSRGEAEGFASALSDWIDEADAADVSQAGTTVTAVFATDAALLAAVPA